MPRPMFDWPGTPEWGRVPPGWGHAPRSGPRSKPLRLGSGKTEAWKAAANWGEGGTYKSGNGRDGHYRVEGGTARACGGLSLQDGPIPAADLLGRDMLPPVATGGEVIGPGDAGKNDRPRAAGNRPDPGFRAPRARRHRGSHGWRIGQARERVKVSVDVCPSGASMLAWPDEFRSGRLPRWTGRTKGTDLLRLQGRVVPAGNGRPACRVRRGARSRGLGSAWLQYPRAGTLAGTSPRTGLWENGHLASRACDPRIHCAIARAPGSVGVWGARRGEGSPKACRGFEERGQVGAHFGICWGIRDGDLVHPDRASASQALSPLRRAGWSPLPDQGRRGSATLQRAGTFGRLAFPAAWPASPRNPDLQPGARPRRRYQPGRSTGPVVGRRAEWTSWPGPPVCREGAAGDPRPGRLGTG